MNLFSVNDNKLNWIGESPFNTEKEIQTLTERNLKNIFGLTFVCSEFSIGDFRLDTLAFNEETKSFVIIEYKRDKNFSVIDQGFTYLSLMLNNKAEFILAYNENQKNHPLQRKDIDWEQPRVMFIAPSFTSYQKGAIKFQGLPIELWEIRRFSNDTIVYDKIHTAGAQASVKTITQKKGQSRDMGIVAGEIKAYTEKEHLEDKSDAVKELYETFRNAILGLEDMEVKPLRLYMAFVFNRNVVDIRVQKHELKMWINLHKGELDDPKNLCRDVSEVGHYGNGDYELSVKSDKDKEYVLYLIKQSLNKKRTDSF